MQDCRHSLDTINQAWPGTDHDSVRIDRPDFAPGRKKLEDTSRLDFRLIEVEPAGCDDHNVWTCALDILPGKNDGSLSGSRQYRVAASVLNNVRDPMPRTKWRIDPVEPEPATPWARRDEFLDQTESIAQ